MGRKNADHASRRRDSKSVKAKKKARRRDELARPRSRTNAIKKADPVFVSDVPVQWGPSGRRVKGQRGE
jgi:hypothetical protein